MPGLVPVVPDLTTFAAATTTRRYLAAPALYQNFGAFAASGYHCFP